MDPATDLLSFPLFHSIKKENQAELTDICSRRNYKRHEMIYAEGDECDGFHIIISGKIKIYKLSIEGKEQILQIFKEGEPFGEVAVFDGKRFPAYAESLTETHTYFFPADDFISLLLKNPAIALNMLSVMSIRLKRYKSLIEDLALKEVPNRLAAHLLYLSDMSGGTDMLTLDISKGQMANILGTMQSTLSRALGKMKAHGYVELHPQKRILLKNREALEKLASGQKLFDSP
ncbi:MAG: Crp/Fnr family transcriptional regulator [Deltaproteobacteria bacterium]|nr:Crp/Fnr family transcriptional regulator [Deltaproteobacteria bacterium]